MQEKRWPVIIFSKIISLGEEYDVFSLGYLPKNCEKYADARSGVKCAFLLPSLSADIRIEIPGLKPKNLLSYAPAALSAAKFLRLVRGLPLSEMEVECEAGKMSVYSGNDGKCHLATKKFTTIRYDEPAELLSNQIKLGCVRSPFGKIKVTKVKSASDFSDSLLRRLTLSDTAEEVIGAVAFSQSEDCVETASNFCKSGDIPLSITVALAVASYIIAGGSPRDISVKVGEDIFDFKLFGGELLVSDRQNKPLTFYAPDIC